MKLLETLIIWKCRREPCDIFADSWLMSS